MCFLFSADDRRHSDKGHQDRRTQRQAPGPLPVPSAGRERSLDEWESADLVAAGVLDTVPGDPPVPVSVWRATGPDAPSVSPHTARAGFSARLAGMLLAIWTDVGDNVIDATADPAVEGAAYAGGRRYRTLELPPPPQQVRDLSGQVALILLRWPPAPPPRTNSGPATMLTAPLEGSDRDRAQVPDGEAGPAPADTRSSARAARRSLGACREMLSSNGHTVVILAPPAGGVYRGYARQIIHVARDAGLGYLQHIVLVTSDYCRRRPNTDPSGAD
jgi:hypothetical protein